MYFLYILKSINYRKSYIGITENVSRRLQEHNAGMSFFTKPYSPWTILYTEECKNREEARQREKYFKSTTGRREMKKMFAKIKPE